jgi:plastocyanin
MKSRQKFQATVLIVILTISALTAGLFLSSSPSWAQNGTVNVSIVPGSSSKTTDAFEPNPVQVDVGETVVWSNDDSTPHTVTSGTGATPDGQFDSSPNFNPLMATGQTFSHTFEAAGEFPYFCSLHPNMVGTVVVGDSPPASPMPAQGNVSQSQTAANATSLEQAKQLYLSAWNNTAFNATFSTFIEDNSALGYGIYQDRVSNNSFRSGETIMLYVEPVGFGHMPFTDQGSTLYLINMTADYVISDSQGNELQRISDVPVGNIISYRQNTELFLILTVTQETPFPEGGYVITYVVHDNVSGESFEITKNVQITGATQSGNSFEDSLDELEDLLDGNQGSDDSGNSGPSANSGSSSQDDADDQEDNCDSAYPDVCIPPSPPDLDCSDISQKNFEVRSSDPHGFDGDGDGVGCES